MSNLYNNTYIIGLTILSLGLVLWAYTNWRIIRRIMAIGFYLIPLGFLTAGFVMMNKEPDVLIERVKVEVPKGREELDELLKEIPRAYGVPEIIARAIVEQESGGNMEAIRFEAGQMSIAGRLTKNPEQQRMLASSHCAMQVMGYHAPSLGLKWSDLYDPRTCVETGMKILADCTQKHKNKSKYNKFYGALACYNGSEKYAKEVMGAVGQRLIEEAL